MRFGKINFISATYLLLMIKRKMRICVVIILNWKFKFPMFYDILVVINFFSIIKSLYETQKLT